MLDLNTAQQMTGLATRFTLMTACPTMRAELWVFLCLVKSINDVSEGSSLVFLRESATFLTLAK